MQPWRSALKKYPDGSQQRATEPPPLKNYLARTNFCPAAILSTDRYNVASCMLGEARSDALQTEIFLRCNESEAASASVGY
jgi:hypothetical protein